MAGFNLGAAITGAAQGYTQGQDAALRRQEARQQIMQNAQAIQAMQMKLDEAKKATVSKAAEAGFLGGPDLQFQPFNIPAGARHGDPTGQGAQGAQQPPMIPAAAAPPGQSSQPMGVPPPPPPQPQAPFPSQKQFMGAVPGAQVNSGLRTPQRNAQVGGVPNSYHLTGQAYDLRPPAGMTTAQYAHALQAKFPGVKVLDEKTHVHVQPMAPNRPPPEAAAAPTPQPAAQQPAAQPAPPAQPQNAAPGGMSQMDFSPQSMVRMKHELFKGIAASNPNLDPSEILDATNDLVESLAKVAALNKPAAGVYNVFQQQAGAQRRTDEQVGERAAASERAAETSVANTNERVAASRANTRERVEAERGKGTGGGGTPAADSPAIQELMKDPGVQFAAAQFLRKGTMPSMGYGAQMNLRRQAVMTLAGKMAQEAPGGIAGTPAAQADFHALSGQLNSLRRTQGSVEQFEGTAQREADLVRSLLPTGGGTSSPVLNKWYQGGREAVGDPNVSRFDGAITSFKNEYARIMSSGGAGTGASTTDAAKAEADRLLNRNQSPAQIRANLDTMQKSMNNRRAAIEKAIEDAQRRFDGAAKGNGQSSAGSRQPSTGGWKLVSVK